MFNNTSFNSLSESESENVLDGINDINIGIDNTTNLLSPVPINPIPLISLDSSSTATNYSRKNNLSVSPRIRSRSSSFSKKPESTPTTLSGTATTLHPNSITTGIANDSNHHSILASRNITPQSHVSSRLPVCLPNSNKNDYTNWAIEKLISLFEYFLTTEEEEEDEDEEGEDEEGEEDEGENEEDEDKLDEKVLEKKELEQHLEQLNGGLKDTHKNRHHKHKHHHHHHILHPPTPFLISLILIISFTFISICAFSFLTTTPDTKICRLPYMNESYRKFPQFNSSSTHLGSKYSLYLYREQNIDPLDDLNGVPVIFIPGNAGSYRQVRSLAAEAAYQFNSLNFHDDNDRFGLDFFTTDFGEDLTAFHGKTLIQQAEYLNEAIKFILSLYESNHQSHSNRKNILKKAVPYPKSVILIGHSMGGIVARTMFTLQNYIPNSINTLLTFAAPHSLPPVSSDPYLVEIYESVNKYWRDSFSQDLIGQNSLSEVSVISIAGGSLDQMIPSDHASISSMVPPSNGITVFTSTIPFVWSGIDHQAIIWCDQLRKVVARSLLDIIDGKLVSKTKAVGERMKIFTKHFLTGLEKERGKAEDDMNPDTLFIYDEGNEVYMTNDDKLKVGVGDTKGSPPVYLVPLPSNESYFSLLTNQQLISPTKFSTITNDYQDSDVENGIYTLACRYLYDHKDISGSLLSTVDVSDASSKYAPTTFICKNMASFAKYLPVADTSYSDIPLAPPDPNSYSSFIYYNTSELACYDFIAIVDNNTPTNGYLLANIENKSRVSVEVEDNLMFALNGKSIELSKRPIMMDVSFKTIWSSLLAYKMIIKGVDGSSSHHHFHPFLRQYVDDPHESKFYLNLLSDTKINVNIHAIAPFSPFNHKSIENEYHNLHFQIWSDDDDREPLHLHLQLDIIASLGKLVLHYRVALAYFPVCITALVFLLQLHIYNTSGTFISFNHGLKIFTLHYFIWLLLLVALLPIIITIPFVDKLFYLIEPSMDPSTGEGPASAFFLARKNQFFLGLERGHLWVLGPLFIIVAVGICHATYCIVLFVTNLFSSLINFFISYEDDSRWLYKLFNRVSMIGLVISTIMVFPYQLSYMLLCILQLISAINQQSHAAFPSTGKQNLIHFTISLLIIMIWITPTNLTTLAVYIHNLKLNWEMPFHSFENLTSLLPMILLCERINNNHMIPKMTRSTQRLLTYCMMIYIAGYSLIFGMQRMYWIYHLVNFFCGWIWVSYVEEYDDN